mmetsp:Transcript_11068/g.19205  ORF Transcript_11068/g.19205 Transcript_11068/m.19205 type:complete len:110 (+) Transcript_11068:1432-1761(+)
MDFLIAVWTTTTRLVMMRHAPLHVAASTAHLLHLKVDSIMVAVRSSSLRPGQLAKGTGIPVAAVHSSHVAVPAVGMRLCMAQGRIARDAAISCASASCGQKPKAIRSCE